MDKKEKDIQRALGTLKKYAVNISADIIDAAWAQETVEAASEEEATEIVQKMVDSKKYEFDWEFNDDQEIDEGTIKVEDVQEE